MRQRIFLLVLALMAIPLAGSDTPASQPEKIHSEELASWFEDAGISARVSSDGKWAIWGRPGRIRLINLETGREEPERLLGGLERVWHAVFHPNGQLVRLGERGTERGWFLPDKDGLRLTPLPQSVSLQWSPDGVHLAFTLLWQEEKGLFVGTTQEQKQYGLGGRVTGFVWSPDSQAIFALVCDANGVSSLVRLTRESGGVETIARNLDAAPSWSAIAISPDGKRLYVPLASLAVPDNEARHDPEAGRDLDIYEIDLATGARRAVVQTPLDDFWPRVANGYLYWTQNHSQKSLAVVPSSGGRTRLVLEDAQIPYWSPDGRQIAFTYGLPRLADWALNMDAGVLPVDAKARPTGPWKPLVTGYHEDFSPTWSPDGQWIAYHSHRSPTPVPSYGSSGSTDDVYLRRTAASTNQEIRLTDFGWEVGMADWSPDGRKLVFPSSVRGAPGVSKAWIVTIDPETGKPLRTEPLPLPDSIKRVGLEAWSPKGDEIAVTEMKEGTARALWVVNLDGTKTEKLLEYSSSTHGGIDWTPDGKIIIYAGLAEGRMQLYAISRAGGTPRQLTREPATLLHPQVSPDGRWIACTRLVQSKQLWRVKLP